MQPALRQLTPKRIADYFVQNVWNINGKCEWITLQYLETDICLGAADDYLYGGISGAAVFFAALNKKYNDPVYQLIFEKIVCQIKLHTENDAKMGDVCGLFTGEASLIYTYLLLYKITEDDSYLIYAQKQADKMMESDAADYAKSERQFRVNGAAVPFPTAHQRRPLFIDFVTLAHAYSVHSFQDGKNVFCQ